MGRGIVILRRISEPRDHENGPAGPFWPTRAIPRLISQFGAAFEPGFSVTAIVRSTAIIFFAVRLVDLSPRTSRCD